MPVYHVVSGAPVQGRLTLVHRGASRRSTDTNSRENSTFVFSHDDVLARRVEYHAPTTWHYLKPNLRRETIHFRLTADGVQPAYDSFHIDVVDANRTPGAGSVHDDVEGHATGTGNRSTLIAAAATSGLAVTAAIVAVVVVVVTVLRGRRRPGGTEEKRPASGEVSAGEKAPQGGVQLPEVVLVAVSNVPTSERRPSPAAAAVVRQPIDVDWSNVDPEILQHCRITDPVLRDEKVWV